MKLDQKQNIYIPKYQKPYSKTLREKILKQQRIQTRQWGEKTRVSIA